jgi:hypothetical protein
MNLGASTINWEFAATPCIEETPQRGSDRTAEYLIALPKQELIEYNLDLREDLGSVRSVLHATTTELAASIERERRLREENARLREQLREERRRHP